MYETPNNHMAKMDAEGRAYLIAFNTKVPMFEVLDHGPEWVLCAPLGYTNAADAFWVYMPTQQAVRIIPL